MTDCCDESELPSGRYYFGDPGYVLSDTDYDDVVMNGPGFYTNGKYIVGIFKTAYGDGFYKDTKGYEYAVDSGTLAVIPVKLCKTNSLREPRVVEFRNPFKVGCTENGMVWIIDPKNSKNCFEIPTADDWSDEDTPNHRTS
jgi:hypothetical protein